MQLGNSDITFPQIGGPYTAQVTQPCFIFDHIFSAFPFKWRRQILRKLIVQGI